MHNTKHNIILDEISSDKYEQGGPTNLLGNIRQNLFIPWLLNDICGRFGINFVNLGTQNNESKVHLFIYKGLNCNFQRSETNSLHRRCDVVKEFSENLMKLRANDYS